MKTFLLPLFLLIFNVSFSQMNLDSLMNELNDPKKYKKAGQVDYLLGKFQQFKSYERNETYDVYLDSLGNLSEYIDLSVVYNVYDYEGRLTKLVGYNGKGGYAYFDYPAIMEIDYKNDTTVETGYNRKSLFSYRTTTIIDEKGRVIEIVDENKDPKHFKRTVNEYSDSLNELITMHYGIDGNLLLDNNGVAFVYQKFDSIDKSFIVEQRFLDTKKKLVDMKPEPNSTGIGCVFSTIYRVIKNGEVFTYYYNSAMEMVCEESDSEPFTLIFSTNNNCR
jgi:hypothetical protein